VNKSRLSALRLPALIVSLVVGLSGTFLAPAAVAANALPELQHVDGSSSLTGLPRPGRTLTFEPGTWTPAEVKPTITFQWYVEGQPVAGATSNSFTIGDLPLYDQVLVRAKATADGYVAAYASEALYIESGLISAPAFTPSGNATVGETLSYRPSKDTGWSPRPTSFDLQWLSDDAPIVGATSETFAVTEAQRGHVISVRVTGYKDEYESATQTSTPTGVILDRFDNAPVPVISGLQKVGNSLTADPGDWGPDASFTYEWRSNGHVIGAGRTLPLDGWNVGATISVIVVGTAGGAGATTSPSSQPTSPIAVGTLKVPKLVFSGSPRVGERIRMIYPATWDVFFENGNYQWFRDGKSIPGAKSPSYVPIAADSGSVLTLKVRSGAKGYTSATATSATMVVKKGQVADPIVKAPATARVGDTIKVAAQLPDGKKATYIYKWSWVGGGLTGSKNTSTRKVTSKDIGHTIVIGVTAQGREKNDGYTAVRVRILGEPFWTASVPTIAGTPRVGETLHANSHKWRPSSGAKIAYQWYYREPGSSTSIKIAQATSATYTAPKSLKGKTLLVTVTGRKTGFETTVRRSNPTAPVLGK